MIGSEGGAFFLVSFVCHLSNEPIIPKLNNDLIFSSILEMKKLYLFYGLINPPEVV